MPVTKKQKIVFGSRAKPKPTVRNPMIPARCARCGATEQETQLPYLVVARAQGSAQSVCREPYCHPCAMAWIRRFGYRTFGSGMTWTLNRL